jgi:hypothetical protein
MHVTSDLEMAQDSQRTVGQWDLASDTVAQSEPPTDGGRDAWLVLTSSFILGATVWGEYVLFTSRIPLMFSQAFLTALASFKNTISVKRSFLVRTPASLQ